MDKIYREKLQKMSNEELIELAVSMRSSIIHWQDRLENLSKGDIKTIIFEMRIRTI